EQPDSGVGFSGSRYYAPSLARPSVSAPRSSAPTVVTGTPIVLAPMMYAPTPEFDTSGLTDHHGPEGGELPDIGNGGAHGLIDIDRWDRVDRGEYRSFRR